jgi:hypothetical protein
MATIANKQQDVGKTGSCKIPVDNLVSINCDQVAWLLDIADRYIPKDDYPRISRQREMKKYGMLYEIMEIARLKFEDDQARWNGTPNEARPYNDED